MAYQRSPGGRLLPPSVPSQNKDKEQAGVRYITEDLLKKVAKQDQLELVNTLNLTLTKEVGKKIRYIENLERLKNLRVLNLSCNIIEKMEKMEKLTRLKELNLSYNKLTKIEGIESLTLIQVLNLTGNEIQSIPQWLPKKLKALRIFKIAKNSIETLSEFAKLRPLPDLTQLTVAENPLCTLPHARSFLVYQLRTLTQLDGQHITMQERHTAGQRYGQDTLDELETRVAAETEEKERLRQEHNRSLQELEEQERRQRALQERLTSSQAEIRELQAQLNAKNDTLKRHTAELNKACEKHYELEQELAFYKIDHKFDTLSRPQQPTSDSEVSVDENGLMGESPYIGKGRFQKHELEARQRLLRQRQQQLQQGSAAAGATEEQLRDMARLDDELAHKHTAIQSAEERLAALQEELIGVEDQLRAAGEELGALGRDAAQRHLTEDDKQRARGELADKIHTVQELRHNTQEIEAEMDETNAEIHRTEQYIGQVRGRLQRMGSGDSLYNAMRDDLAAQEQHLAISRGQYSALQQQLSSMLATVAREAGAIGRLEAELRDGQAAQNDDMRRELEGIIGGLQAYLTDMQDKADRQRDEYDELLRERGELSQRLADMEAAVVDAQQQAAEVEALREKMAEAESQLAEVSDVNKSLQLQLSQSHNRSALDEHNLSLRVAEADEEVRRLREAVKEADKRAQQEKAALEKQVTEERKKMNLLKSKVRQGVQKDDEIGMLQKNLGELQQSNARLQDKLFAQQQRLLEEKKKNVNPDQLKKRLDEVTRAIKTGKAPLEPVDSEDEVGFAIGDLQEKLQRELDKSLREVDRALRERDQAEEERDNMRDAIVQVQEEERRRAERAIQAMMEENRQENMQLKAHIERLQEELEREREAERGIPDHLLQPSVAPTATSSGSRQTEATTATTTGESCGESATEESTSVPSSQWSKKKRELYEDMTEEEQMLFDELQAEIDELKRLLGMGGSKEFDVARIAASIDKKTKKLRDMMTSRTASRKTSSESSAAPAGVTAVVGRGQGGGKNQGVGGRGGGGREERGVGGQNADEEEAAGLREVARELTRAHETIDALTSELHAKTRQLKEARSDGSSTIADQQEEIADLHDILAEQKVEISRLHGALDRIRRGSGADQAGGSSRGGGVVYDEEGLQEVHRGAESVMSHLSRHRQRIHNIRPAPARDARDARYPESLRRDDERRPSQHAVDGGYSSREDAEYMYDGVSQRHHPAPGHGGRREPQQLDRERYRDNVDDRGYREEEQGYHDNGGYPRPELREDRFAPGRPARVDDRGYPVDERGYPVDEHGYPVDRLVPPPHGGSGGGGGSSSSRGGRPVPTFYGPDGAQLPPAQGPYHPHAHQHGPPPGQQQVMPGYQHQQQQQQQPHTQQPFPGPLGQHTGAPPLPPGHLPPGAQPSLPHLAGAPPLPHPAVNSTFGHMAAPPGSASVSMPAMAAMTGALPAGAGQQVPGASAAPGGSGYVPASQGGYAAAGASYQPQVSGGGHGVAGARGVQQTGAYGAPILIQQHGGGVSLPTTPTRPPAGHVIYAGTGGQHSAPTTPIAGSDVSGHVLSAPNTPSQHPMMMSTPLIDRGGGGSSGRGGLKGILKKQRSGDEDEEEELVCTVPEHHDLEDYIDKLQNKIRTLKGKGSKSKGDSSSFGFLSSVADDSSKRVLFEDDIDKKTIKRLQAELQNRRAELEGLDLAVERQKTALHGMQREEETLREQREEAMAELREIRAGPARRRAFLSGNRDYTTYDSDYEYDYHPRSSSRRTRVEYVQDEIACLESTLAKRRAELREADRLMMEVTSDLKHARSELRGIVTEFNSAQEGYQTAAQDHEAIEERTRTAAMLLIKTEEEAAKAVETLRENEASKQKQTTLLDELKQLILLKHKEFKTIEAKIEEAKQSLSRTHIELHSAEAEHQVKQQEIKDAAMNSTEQKQALRTVWEQVQTERTRLASLKDDIAQGHAKLQDIEATIRNRSSQLEALNHDAESEITKKRSDIQLVEESVQDVLSRRRQLEEELTRQQQVLIQEKRESERVQAESAQKTEDLRVTRQQLESERAELESARSERRQVEDAVTAARKERASLEDSLVDGKRRLGELRRVQTQLEEMIRSHNNKVQRLDRELSLAETALHGGRAELDDIQTSLLDADGKVKSLEQTNRQMTDEKFASMEARVKQITSELSRREEEKQELAGALERAYTEVQTLRSHLASERQHNTSRLRQQNADLAQLRQTLQDRARELVQYREKASSEIADLESIAQAHHSRATRLSDELNYLRAEYLELKRTMESHSDFAEKERKMEAALKEFKNDIKTVEKFGYTHHLKKSQAVSDSTPHQIPPSCGALSDTLSFSEQQQLLKQQLAQKMQRSAESLQAQRQISQSSLEQLQNKLHNLEQLSKSSSLTRLELSSSTHPTLSSTMRESRLDSGISLGNASSQDSGSSSDLTQTEPKHPKRAYSPNRHSNNRSRRTPSPTSQTARSAAANRITQSTAS